MKNSLLWWGRFDPGYSRNRILRTLLKRNHIGLEDFRPRSSLLGSLESMVFRPRPADAIWVPCFRHRDFNSARRYADKLGVKLVFDPLISSWDKVVQERAKYPAEHFRAKRLLKWERSLFSRADIVIADTLLHANFYVDKLAAPADCTRVIPVGAEESLFTPQPLRPLTASPEVLFFGSFIELQGPQHIIEAARQAPGVRWTLLGDGPLRSRCETLAGKVSNVHFENWLPYEQLAERIGQADVLLGVFGDSAKAGRVIPNKVYQALACGRPVVTRVSKAYPPELQNDQNSGLVLVAPANPEALAGAVSSLISHGPTLSVLAEQAHKTYQQFFSESRIEKELLAVLADLEL